MKNQKSKLSKSVINSLVIDMKNTVKKSGKNEVTITLHVADYDELLDYLNSKL